MVGGKGRERKRRRGVSKKDLDHIEGKVLEECGVDLEGGGSESGGLEEEGMLLLLARGESGPIGEGICPRSGGGGGRGRGTRRRRRRRKGERRNAGGGGGRGRRKYNLSKASGLSASRCIASSNLAEESWNSSISRLLSALLPA